MSKSEWQTFREKRRERKARERFEKIERGELDLSYLQVSSEAARLSEGLELRESEGR